MWEEGLAILKLVQKVGLGSDTGRDEFDIHRIAYPGNFLDPHVLVNNFKFGVIYQRVGGVLASAS